jgi:hypothetical protein
MGRKTLLTDDPAFDIFWQAYPRREARLDALKAWGQMQGTAAPSVILEGAKRYAERCRREGRETKYIALPASWLRAGRWDDQEPTVMSSVSTHQGRHQSKDEERRARWTAWETIRTSKTAQIAADEGWAWNLKCRVLDGSIKNESEIEVSVFRDEHDECSQERIVPQLREPFLSQYYDGRRQLLIFEEQVASEIWNVSRAQPSPAATE